MLRPKTVFCCFTSPKTLIFDKTDNANPFCGTCYGSRGAPFFFLNTRPRWSSFASPENFFCLFVITPPKTLIFEVTDNANPFCGTCYGSRGAPFFFSILPLAGGALSLRPNTVLPHPKHRF